MLIIDPDSPRSPYKQLHQQLTRAIDAGELAAGTKLATVRRLAADLGIAPNTVARTYQELEREGLIHTRGRRGSFVADQARPAQDPLEARQAADRYVETLRGLQVDDATALRLVRLALARLGGTA